MMDIYITLDYELFLGKKTGTSKNCLIRPMDELCSVANQIGFKYIIFVDAAYLLRMSQLKDQCPQLLVDYTLVTNHIKQLAENGHDIQLHFHPQWLYSNYNNTNKEWNLDFMHYKLSDMEHDFAFKSFSAAKRLLDDIVGYKTYAFRAGGYCLDSFQEFPKLFKENGICIDSSVARGQYIKSSVHSYDYRNIPSNQIYFFTDNLYEENKKGEFTELSISSFSCPSLYYYAILRKMSRRYSPRVIFRDGDSISDGKNKFLFWAEKICGRFRTLCNIDAVTSCYLDYFYNRIKQEGYKEMIILGHPKNSTDASIANFKRFIENHRNDRFLTTKDLRRER